MRCELYKVGDEVDHLSFYDISLSDVKFLKNAIVKIITDNKTRPNDRDKAEEINKALRDCSVFDI